MNKDHTKHLVMLTSQKKSTLAHLEEETIKENRMEQEKMREIHLLLENLFKREETTVKMVLACLYDVGAVNLINKKFQNRSLNGLMKYVANLSKPLFLIVAVRWFHKNVPTQLTSWLISKVNF